MKLLAIVLLSSFGVFAAQCICQYPNVDSDYGRGYEKEILAYKAGCSLWLSKQKSCSSRSIVDINSDLLNMIKPTTKFVKLGFVGHWPGSDESVKFLDEVVRPIVETSDISFGIDNTACRPMENAKLVQDSIQSYSYSQNYITFKGAQTDSIGIWDKLTRILRKADLMAFADSRKKLKYPSCKSMTNKICLRKVVMNQSGKCSSNNKEISLSCRRSKLSKKIKVWKYTNL